MKDVTDDNDNVIIDCTADNIIDCDYAADDVIDCAADDYDDITDCAADDNDDVIDCAINDNDGDICYAAESDVGTAITLYCTSPEEIMARYNIFTVTLFFSILMTLHTV